jgi:hypothetical protein
LAFCYFRYLLAALRLKQRAVFSPFPYCEFQESNLGANRRNIVYVKPHVGVRAKQSALFDGIAPLQKNIHQVSSEQVRGLVPFWIAGILFVKLQFVTN